MTEISDQVREVMREAIKLEINGRAFFQHAEEATHSELGKKMFKKLAQDEVRHLETFRELFSRMIGSDQWDQFIREQQIKGPSSVIEGLKARVKKGDKSGELEAISIGMDLERNAVEFFERSSQESTDKKAQEIFKQICEEEKLHYALLQAQLDSVSNSGFWLDMAEFKMDGKF